MAGKNHSDETDERGRVADSAVADAVAPEDDVTSEISNLLAEEFGAEAGAGARAPITVTDSNLSAHVEHDVEVTLAPGFTLSGRFEIVELVHSGGMGHVYKAVDRDGQGGEREPTHVAIKMLRESLAHRQDLRLALEREASKAQALSHPNIIRIFDFNEHDGRFYLVMEWLDGESVNSLLRRTSGQRLAPESSWPIIEGAARAIRHAHVNNVVHADVNPSNIFITATDEIKLLDFGVARYVNELHDPAEDEVQWVTQTYASPEVLSGMTPVFEDDVFSLGCIAYRLLAGKHPFGGAPSIVARRNGVTVEPIPGLPEDDWQLLRRALAYSRVDRPDTVGAFLGRDTTDRSSRLRDRLRLLLPVAATALIAVTVAWLFWPDPDRLATPGDAGAVPDAADGPSVAGGPDAAELIAAARQAMSERRLVLPVNDNARALYREVLLLDPEDPEALRGLREISDEFVERADTALRIGNPRIAAAALTLAEETDAQNPAIRIVSELLVAQGDARLTAARLAAADGDVQRATALLDQAQQYAHIDANAVAALREQIARQERDTEFLDRLAAADAHIEAGRLVRPAGGNARAVLAAIGDEFADDPRLRLTRQRLAERLLTRAAFAATAGRIADAEGLIDEAESLGVLAAEIEVARTSLASRAAAREPPGGGEQKAAPAEPAEAAIAAGSATPAGDELPGETAELPVAADEPPAEVRQPTVMRMEDLGIERFVPPAYPRGAQRRGLTGFVDLAFDVNPNGRTSAIEVVRADPADVFDKSAADAVRQWRFAPRENTVRANVTLRFEISR